MIELDLLALLQIDATIITGILILLTLSKAKQTTGHFVTTWIPTGVAFVVIPFSFSALLVILNFIFGEFNTIFQSIAYYGGLILMAIGFVYIMIVVLTLTNKKHEKI